MQARMRRRTLLGLAVAAAVVPVTTACTPSADPGPDPSTPTGVPTDDAASRDNAVRSSAAAAETELIARYVATIAAHATLASSLAPLADQHREHLAALGPDAMNDDPGPLVTPMISPDPVAALAEIIAAERAAADARTTECEQSVSVELTRLLATIAASEASHAEALSTDGPTS